MQTGFRTARDKKRLMAEINVVPYIDITLVLLIIFMVTAPIVQQAVTVQLPQAPEMTATDEGAAPIKPFVITVTQDGQYKTSEAPDVILTQSEITLLVAETVARAQLNQALPVYIQGDRDAPYGRVVHLFVVLKNNGVPNVSLLTEPESAK
ncbi:biopolymer transporter ExbD [Thiomicrospira microaerophila]|uniref:biopolymer transporter ExbD n=1 Tax=Thiomicrospira microaerophila TaxID=406020 RepID=UPI0005C84BF7|nr:biopolymer transporter ExbD [Thiomicrospira microaerophila]